MSGFFESKLLKRTVSEWLSLIMKFEKRCLRHGATMDLQACDRIRSDLIPPSPPPANKSMMYSKISSGSAGVSMIYLKDLSVTETVWRTHCHVPVTSPTGVVLITLHHHLSKMWREDHLEWWTWRWYSVWIEVTWTLLRSGQIQPGKTCGTGPLRMSPKSCGQ